MSNAMFRKQISILEKYLNRNDLVEIIINREGEVILETTSGEWLKKADKNITIQKIRSLTETMATMSGQKFDLTFPMFSGRIPSYDYRIQVNIGAHVASGVAVAIRIGQSTTFSIDSYMTEDKANQLIQMVKEGRTILINAATGCGKTTFLNSLIAHIPLDQRIITLEDTQELIVPHSNCIAFLKSKNSTDIAGLKFGDFINSMLRLRPDRILLGEIDIENTMAFLNIANSGHSGSISTIHADNANEALNKLCLNAQLSGVKGGKDEILGYANEAIDCFVSLSKNIENGKRVFRASFTENF
ncbi:ATPase, T2SS/T4P/T4SS family [Vibrio lentus]|uniref:ATPase, T2SS/T4P/T4SS family n=1 Tax=Vibrio lentus TaxID=136468 RepID=UPI0012FFDC78|nr:ATPase, T2SS/T4P/T4SS family [Vibrio lentus]